MRRTLTRLTQLGIDLTVLVAALAVALLLRFDWAPPVEMLARLVLTLPYVVLLEYLVLVAFGVHRFSWRYIGLRETVRIAASLGVATMVLVATRLLLGRLQFEWPVLRHGVLPLGAVAANYVLAVLGICGVRGFRRLLGERREHRASTGPHTSVPTMIVGAGQAGHLVAQEMARNPGAGLRPVGFLDDDPAKVGMTVHGHPGLGTTKDLSALCRAHGAKQVLIAISRLPGSRMRDLRAECDAAEMPMKVLPGLYDIVGGRVNLSRIREVAIEDLLRRDPVTLDEESLASFLRNRVVMVTGAGGSIGSELCRQVLQFAPRELVLVEQAENSLFEVHRELTARSGLLVVPVVADVCDAARLDQVVSAHRPSIILHAAAHKHVPMMEWNPNEAIKNNVGGSICVADAAHRHGCDAFVMVSTDKAVNPTSVMGATKRRAELYVQCLGERSATRFVTVRFGNVLGSNGSVVPIFKEQISRGGPVTVTDPEMRRYFMTIPEACQLVLQAGSMGAGGEIFVLDMGKPVKIVDLARDLIGLSGLREGEDIEIVFTGSRPGEKLFEELSSEKEGATKTRHPKIFIGRSHRPAWAAQWHDAKKAVTALLERAERGEEGAPEAIRRLVPEYARKAPRPEPARKHDALVLGTPPAAT